MEIKAAFVNQTEDPVRMEDMLAQAFAVSANLALRRDRSAIVGLYDRVRAAALRRSAAIARHMEDDAAIGLTGLSDFIRIAASEKPLGALFAVPQIGPFALAAALIARWGIKIATVFWEMEEEKKRLLRNSNVLLLNLDQSSAPLAILRNIAEIQHSGYNVCLLIEVPMQSRRRYSFMGYQVTCSSLIEIYSHFFKRKIHTLYSVLDHAGDVKLHIQESRIEKQFTQALLSWAEEIALSNIEQYNWSEASIVFSDPVSYENGLSFLPEILGWRERKRYSPDRCG